MNMIESEEQTQKFDLKYQINFIDIFLFVNNKWVLKLIQLVLIVSFYSVIDFLLKFVDNVQYNFLKSFGLNFLIFGGFYLFTLVLQSGYISILDHWSKGLKIDNDKIAKLTFEMKNSKLTIDNWDFVTKVRICWNRYFYIYYNRSQAHIIPFRAFKNQEEINSFREFLKSKNKLK
jgi:hypothetical protein